jgi:hypothetical protein
MRYAVLYEPGASRLWWSTLDEAININAGRFLDNKPPAGIIKLCPSAEAAAHCARTMRPVTVTGGYEDGNISA